MVMDELTPIKPLRLLRMIPKPSHIIEKEVSPRTLIPDGDLLGISSIIQINDKGIIESVEAVSIDISHTYQGDLMVSLISPDNTITPLHEGQGGGIDNLVNIYTPGNVSALKQLAVKSVQGKWKLKIVDKWTDDTGTLNRWSLKVNYRVLKGAASHFIAKTCITDM